MIRYAMLSAALLIAAPAAAQDQADPLAPQDVGASLPTVIDSQTAPEDFDLAKKKVLDCEGEQFVFAWGAGARPTKVTLCSKKDATPDEVVQMLDDAATKLELAEGLAEDRRTAIVQQMRAKIAELRRAPAAMTEPVTPTVAASAVTVPRSALASNGQAPAPPPEYAALPPMPTAMSKPPAPATPPAKPRLSFECYTPGEAGTGGRCIAMNRDTRLTFKAGEALPAGIGLRFRRNGETRAEVALEAMRNGQRVQLVLPRDLCSGVVEAESQIQVVRGGHVVDSIGPYLLRC